MTYYSQKDPRWANEIYAAGLTFKAYGCFVTSLAMICDIEPPKVAEILRNNGCFDSQGYLNSDKAAVALGLEYNGVSKTRPDYDCICETAYFAPKNPQHFFVLTKDGVQDPLGLGINYPIKSYRLFKRIGEDMGRIEELTKQLEETQIKLTVATKERDAYQAKSDRRKEQIAELEKQLPCPVCEPQIIEKIVEVPAKCPPCPVVECPPCPVCATETKVVIDEPIKTTDIKQPTFLERLFSIFKKK